VFSVRKAEEEKLWRVRKRRWNSLPCNALCVSGKTILLRKTGGIRRKS
jgi:hypothetical protein